MLFQARRSMRFSKHLRDVADEFRQEHLNSNDKLDKTILDPDWTKMKVCFVCTHRTAFSKFNYFIAL